MHNLCCQVGRRGVVRGEGVGVVPLLPGRWKGSGKRGGCGDGASIAR